MKIHLNPSQVETKVKQGGTPASTRVKHENEKVGENIPEVSGAFFRWFVRIPETGKASIDGEGLECEPFPFFLDFFSF